MVRSEGRGSVDLQNLLQIAENFSSLMQIMRFIQRRVKPDSLFFKKFPTS